jgi:biopolymer transport protein ExbB
MNRIQFDPSSTSGPRHLSPLSDARLAIRMRRLSCVLLISLLACGASSWLPRATAQDTADETPIAADELEPLAGAEDAPSPSPQRDESSRTLFDTLKDGGITGLFIGLLSMVGLGFAIEHFITIRKSALMPENVADELQTMIQEGRLDEASDYCADPANESLIAEVVGAGLQRFRSSEFGFAEYKAAVEEAGEDQTGRLYRKTEVLGVVGTIAPMLGLLGTVLGMIEAFNQIAATEGAARPHELASGISKALVTTMMGLYVAIPAMLAFSYFRNQIDSIVAETGKRVEQILTPLGRRR